MNKSIAAYRGDEPYVFICYAHKDADSVYADLTELDHQGIHLWYDEGIPAGSSWRAEIAAAISGAERFIFFISEASLASSHCLREVDFALSHEIDIIPVYLQECVLPPELELVLNRVHALFKTKDATYMQRLLGALRGDKGLAALLPGKNRKKLGLAIPLLMLAVGALSLWIWLQREAALPTSSGSTSIAAGPNGYDRYLEATKLMERWDKDDNLETAVNLFREVISVDPGFALAYARLAGSLRLRYAVTRDEAWLAEAVEWVDKAVNLNPGLAPVQTALGRIHATRGNYDLAFAALERALAIDPNDAAANQGMAIVYERLGRLEDAEASFQKALALDPESFVIRDSFANFLFRQGRLDDAEKQWRTVVRNAPDHYGALVNLGAVLSQSGRVSEAITVYKRAIEIKPTYMAYSNLATAYGRAERYADAVEALKKALEINETDWLAWGNLAYAYSWMENMETQAAESFARAIQLAEAARQENPRDSYANSDLALYYAKSNQTELALQRLETAIALAPDSGEILAAGAEVYEIMGQRDRAIELARRSILLGFPRQRFQRNPEFSELVSDPRMQSMP